MTVYSMQDVPTVCSIYSINSAVQAEVYVALYGSSVVLAVAARHSHFPTLDGSACQTVFVICRDRQIVLITGKQTAKQMLIYGPPQRCRRHNGTA